MSSAPGTDRLAFDRSDRIGLKVVLWAVVVLMTIGTVVVPLGQWIAGSAVEARFLSEVTVPQLDRAGVTYGDAEYSVRVEEPGALQYLAALAPGVVLVALAATAALVVQRIANDVGRGAPFASGQVRRLRILAAICLLGALLWTAVDLAAQGVLLSGLDRGGLPPASIDLPIGALVAGLMLALVAEAFKHGDRLEGELEGVI